MLKERNIKNVYGACEEEGSFIPLAKVDEEQIKTMLNVALTDLESVGEWLKNASPQSGQWNAIFKLHYDTLHTMAEALVLFDKRKVRTHECLFAYICEKHAELKLNWNFLDDIRTKRNRSLYYGQPIRYDDWKEIESQLIFSISTIRDFIEKKLNRKLS